ncbi:type 1 glutamine amidotransferase domain-containing protein [Streptomyces europaeiscabiei]|uniref:Type 1 glutamine amidotransferase domain-containing protein n=1 Tax=Streptomyces europaeiscabiei TaxID=146819 RepID=A0AAJ2PM15_9ACTN|nr:MULTISPECIES: type 1 glutamine amidotransferase domain-containing protein [Streptomyces]KFF99024.1 thiamine biosynthesis protein ThiJ [Streptomyces scabiei]MDX3129684.1 type 1 glutamine amidotransferase domain-containing protein [Streptomyces europaeiscabiei]
MSRTNRILVIVTSVGEYRTVGYRTGLWLGELTHFYDVAEAAGFELTIASIDGGPVPIDPESLAHNVLGDLGTDKRYADREFMDKLRQTIGVAQVEVDDYDAIYLTGGHGVMFDFHQSEALETLIARFYESGRIVSAVCHGPCGLLDVTLTNGDPLVKDKNVTGFSWREEELAQRAEAVPYSLEERLKELGAVYSIAEKPFATYVVEDTRLITGQNPGSAKAVAEAVVRQLS